MNSPEGNSFSIGGVKVQFPGKPYPSQLAMMNKIINGVERQQNCLLESPTGSGKSLALICSALAWQRAEYEKQEEAEALLEGSGCTCAPNKIDDTSMCTDIENILLAGIENSKSEGCDKAQCSCSIETKPQKKVPKIWFGTRTHKQIGQIARELGKTDYKHTRMNILSSREHTCVHPQISSSKHKNDECKALLEGPGCSYHDRVKRVVSQKAIASQGLQQAWELEEFVTFCRKNQCCPYYGTRELRMGADIIFCPYNYLVDPQIRESMDISLKGEIVILDEGHNIEDACREAASFTVQEKQLSEGVQDLQHLIEENFKPSEHAVLKKLLQGFVELMDKNQEGFEDGDQSKVWGGMEMIALIESVGIGAHNIELYQRCLNEITEEESDPKKREEQRFMKAKRQTLNALEGLLMVIKFALADNHKHADDYRLAITKTTMYVRQPASPRNGWFGRKGNRMQPETVCCLNFWCLNPAVAFGSMGQDSRTVILTSGTLSPMTSFQSELGASFPIQLEANHVISASQVWVGTISNGPKGGSLLGSYQNSETFRYQDEVGELILHVCQIVPDGVLCFLPSYKSLQKLTDRWKNTGLWAQFMNHKQVFSESRASDKEDFDETMKSFYESIHDEDQETHGGLFFAVCRGKVSEGMDFSDRNARAVIAIGIPFPNYKDTQVELKQKYNNTFGQKRGLLSGRDWYEIQAYRALNQALGRCIRHRGDWGALILVDERYSKNPTKYTKGLSKWVRNKVQCYTNYNVAKDSLAKFVNNMASWEPPTDDASILNSQRSPTQPIPPSPALEKPPPVEPLKPSYKVTGSVRAVLDAIRKIALDVSVETLVVSEETQEDGTVMRKNYIIKPAVKSAAEFTPVKQESNSEDMFSDTQCSPAPPMMSTQVLGKALPVFNPSTQTELPAESNNNNQQNETAETAATPVRKPLFKPKIQTEEVKDDGDNNAGGEEGEDFAVLKTYRTKRRNSSYKNSTFSKRSRAKAVEYIDDSDEEPITCNVIQLACPKCSVELASSKDAVKESFEPFFWKNMKSSNHPFSAITLDARLFDDRLSVFKSSHSGVELNSLWQDGVLVQYMACSQCLANDAGAPPLAAFVMKADNQKRLKPSQMWVIPECLKT